MAYIYLNEENLTTYFGKTKIFSVNTLEKCVA